MTSMTQANVSIKSFSSSLLLLLPSSDVDCQSSVTQGLHAATSTRGHAGHAKAHKRICQCSHSLHKGRQKDHIQPAAFELKADCQNIDAECCGKHQHAPVVDHHGNLQRASGKDRICGQCTACNPTCVKYTCALQLDLQEHHAKGQSED